MKCLAQEHNAVLRPGLEQGPLDPESSALHIRPPRLPSCTSVGGDFVSETTRPSRRSDIFKSMPGRPKSKNGDVFLGCRWTIETFVGHGQFLFYFFSDRRGEKQAENGRAKNKPELKHGRVKIGVNFRDLPSLTRKKIYSVISKMF